MFLSYCKQRKRLLTALLAVQVCICASSFSTLAFTCSSAFPKKHSLYPGQRLLDNIVLRAKKGKKRRSLSKSRKHSREKESMAVKKEETPTTSVSLTTGRLRASVAGVLEDHNYEQFFYTKQSTQQIYQYVTQYSSPLLLCNPSLAILAHEDSSKPNYLLLDRDKRFEFLPNYQEFDLNQPSLAGISKYQYDAVFIDPPFANVTPDQLVRCLRLIATTKERLQADIYIAYNSRREEQLIAAFDKLPCPALQRLWPLQYKSVRDGMKEQIFLYGPISC